MKQLITLLVLLILTVACSQKKSSEVPIVNLVNHETVETYSILLSDIAESIKIIPLETSETVLVSRIRDVKFHNERLYIIGIYDCMAFDMGGKFLNMVGMQGRGPQEYVSLYDIYPVKNNLWIINGSGDKVLKHNKDGEFIERFNLDKKAGGTDFFVSSGEEIISFIPDQAQLTTDIMLAFSNSSGIIDSILYRNPIGDERIAQMFLLNEAQFAENGNEIRFKYFFNDTIYTIKGHKIYPYMTLDLGSRGAIEHVRVLPKNQDLKTANFFKDMDRVDFLGESEGYLYLRINDAPLFYNKADKIVHKWSFTLPDNEYIAPESLENFKGVRIDGSGNLIGWANPANEEDNPVIIIAKLR